MLLSSEAMDNNILVNDIDVQNKGGLHYAKMEMIEDLKAKSPELQNLSPDEAEESLIYGMKVHLYTEKAKLKEGIAYTTDEDSVTVLLPKSKKRNQIKIYLLKITDISKGKLAGNFKRVEKGSNVLLNVDEKCCLTIHYDNNFKYYNFIFKDEKQLELFIFAIIRFLEKTIIEEIKISNTDLLSLKKIWKEYDPNHNKYLNEEQFTKFLANINFQWKKKKFDQIFREIDSKKEGKIRFKDFISFYELIVTGEEFREIFQKYSSDPSKKYLTMRGLSDFLEKEQHVKLSSQEILTLMSQFSKKTKKLTEMMKNNKKEENVNNNNINIDELEIDLNKESLLNVYENHSFGKNYYTDLNNNQDNFNQMNFKNAFTLTFREFVNILLDKNTNAVYNQEFFSIHQNMNLPLYSYFMYSSHNTYLEGNQINSKSSIEMYYCALKNGCRLIELDCWDGRNGVPEEPIITHWHFPVGEVNFRDVLVVLKDYAFKKSEFPVLLSVENHCSPKAQMNMEKYFREVLGEENLYILNPHDPPLNYPSPNELKRKFVIKCKRKRIFGNFEKNVSVKKSSSDGKGDKFNSQVDKVEGFNNNKENKISLAKITINNNNLSHFFNDNESLIGGGDKQDKPPCNSTTNILPVSPVHATLIKEPLLSLFAIIPDENILNRKKQLVQTEEIIQEEDLNSKNEDLMSDVDENVSSNMVYANDLVNNKFKPSAELDNNFKLKNKENLSCGNLQKLENQTNSNPSIKIDLSNLNNNKSDSNSVNVNLNLNLTTITNNYFLPNKGSLINLTKTGSFNRSVAENEINRDGLKMPVINEILLTEKTEEENTKPANSFKNKSITKGRKKSFSSFDSGENKEKNEALTNQPTNSNQLLKKLKKKYSVEEGNSNIGNVNKKENAVDEDNEKNSINKNVQAEIIRIQEIKITDTLKINKPKIKTIDQLATVVGMVGVKYKKEDFENSQYLPWECISISEPDFEKYIQNIELKIKIIKFCQRGFLKIYPDIMRTNSSNHDPIQCWSAGVQIAALNLQKTDDDWVLINKIFFKINGGSKSGYILKPDTLLNPHCDEAIKKMFWKPVFRIKLKILSGFHLHLCFPKGIKVASIFIEVTLRSPRNPEEDQNFRQVVLTTETISNNYLHPVWQSNSKQFEIYDPDLSFFIIKIYSFKRQYVLARSVIPVKILKLGYRVLDLYDNMCSKFDSSFLIVKTNKIFLN